MAEQASDTRPADDAAATATPTVTEGTPAATEGAATPISRDEDPQSIKVSLADLSARGTALYAQRQYEDAAEVFSQASVLQAELNGETAPENAEILFHYGRSLFKVGQSKSDVLGGPAAVEKKPSAPAKAKAKASGKTEVQTSVKSGVSVASNDPDRSENASEKKDGESPATKASGTEEKKALFHFEGDENFDHSSDEEQEEEPEEEEEDEDDLATAFEILDLARVCYEKQLEQLNSESDSSKGKEVANDSPAIRHIKERLADTHDCLSEISLESERYPNAIEDGRVSLNYKLQLYPEESEIIAEAHYKLSLAMEFASVTMSDDDGKNAKREEMDQGLRDEAIKEMELAIKSFKLKMQNKEVEVATMASPEDNDITRKAITEMKELIADMEQRLLDLRQDPVNADDLLGSESLPLGSILGGTLGESAADTQARVEEAKKKATDLTGLVRKKKPAATEEPSKSTAAATDASASTGEKRKAEEDASVAAESPKKSKVDES
ncbi:hypothetical protein E4U57_006006 [Claviceps arundinis]|uniref:Tetratricopeptide SHNi-TPR domain-containing protein n=1 Tax=Claviceps arundinis TaxID=1623583 RepID=A0A9P7MWG7_9HYPO|nr:hypothetical protein E4U57_006006 [Claviceps arundinis]KAG5970741.1 hypothetical protein E4U56_007440 [Claviceps arundinis]